MHYRRRAIVGAFTFVLHASVSLFLFFLVASGGLSDHPIDEILLLVLTFPTNLLAVLFLLFGANVGLWTIFLIGINSAVWGYIAYRYWPVPRRDYRLCAGCGYDIRCGRSESCPECGRPLESIQLTMLSRVTDEDAPEDIVASLMRSPGPRAKASRD